MSVAPELKLIVAVLERALWDLFGPDGHDKQTAEAWVDAWGVSDQPFCYLWICQALDIDPMELRKRMYKMRKEKWKMPKRGGNALRDSIVEQVLEAKASNTYSRPVRAAVWR